MHGRSAEPQALHGCRVARELRQRTHPEVLIETEFGGVAAILGQFDSGDFGAREPGQ